MNAQREQELLDEYVGAAVPPELRSPGRPLGLEDTVPFDPAAQYGSNLEQDAGPASEAQVLQGGDRPLHNDRVAYYKNKHEKPEHRIIAFLKAQGHTNREIADLTGYTPVAVSNILRQPWARTVTMEEIRKAGRDAVQEVLQATAMESVETLIAVRDSGDASLDVRRKAANDLLDRVYGKPNQPITHVEQVDLDALTDSELAALVVKGRAN